MSELLGWKKIPMVVAFKSSLEYKTGSWRTRRPVVDYEKCTKCYFCHVYCPDDAVKVREDGSIAIDYDYCKGCGVCAAECPVGAIEMVIE